MDLLAHARAMLVAELGPNHPQLDAWAQRAVELYLGSLAPEMQPVRPLSPSQERVLATLLES